MRTILVICGAAIGAPARFAIDQYIRKFTSQPFLYDFKGIEIPSSRKIPGGIGTIHANRYARWRGFSWCLINP